MYEKGRPAEAWVLTCLLFSPQQSVLFPKLDQSYLHSLYINFDPSFLPILQHPTLFLLCTLSKRAPVL